MLVVTPAIANLIRENKIFRITSSDSDRIAKYGMQLLDDHIFQLWRRGIIDKDDGMMKCNKPDELAARIAEAEKGLFDDDAEDDD